MFPLSSWKHCPAPDPCLALVDHDEHGFLLADAASVPIEGCGGVRIVLLV
jgi:hypothetical protein